MRTRRLPLLIPADQYQTLAELARREERDPFQQARYLLRQALERAVTQCQADAPAGSEAADAR